MNLKENKHLISIYRNILLIIPILLASSIQAQVTIGSALTPNKGTLLDLKEWKQPDDDANSTKGVMLPRVRLTKIDELVDIVGANGSGYDGLMVYNVNDNACDGPIEGTYVWNGSAWIGIGVQDKSPDVYEVTDPRDGEVYLARNFGDIAGDWMLENLRYVPKDEDGYEDYEHRATDAPAPYTAKYYAYPEEIERPYISSNHPSPQWESKKRNGLLYNWAAATNGENTSTAEQSQKPTGIDPVTTPIQGICPPDWHVPSDKELNDLEREIYNNAHLYSTYSESDKNSWEPWQSEWEYTATVRPAKSTAGAHGTAMRNPCLPGSNITSSGGRSLTPELGGFSLPLAGYGSSGSTTGYKSRSTLWTSSSHNGANAKDRYIRADINGVYINISGRSYLFSVRCKK